MEKSKRRTETENENVNETSQPKKKSKKELLYFILGVLLSVSISMSGMYAVCAGNRKFVAVETGESDTVKYLSEATMELVKETVVGNVEEYLKQENITSEITEEQKEELTEYVLEHLDVEQNVTNITEISDEQMAYIENLVSTSVNTAVDEVNEYINTNIEIVSENVTEYTDESVETALENATDYTDTSVDEAVENVKNEYIFLTDDLRTYIDETVVPGIYVVLSMTEEEIVALNEKITALNDSYEDYKEENAETLENIVTIINENQKANEQAVSSLTEVLTQFHNDYDAYVNDAEKTLTEIDASLDECVKIADFEKFKESYETYKEEMSGCVADIEEALADLDNTKAGKTALNALSEELAALQTTYETFTKEEFSALSDRVTNVTDTVTNNSSAIETLNLKVAELELQLETAEGKMETLDSELATKLTSSDLLDEVYPVGSIYMSMSDVSPATFLGGTWERIIDTTLVGAGNSYSVGSTGGSTTATLSASNIPSLNITGTTTAKNGVTTSANGAYSGTIASSGNYIGGVYTTSTDGKHSHSLNGWSIMFESTTTSGIYALAKPFEHNNWGDNTQLSGAHSHTVSIPSQTIFFYGNISIGNHSHTVNIPALSLTGTYTNSSVQAFNVQDPYTAVYMWKRIS